MPKATLQFGEWRPDIALLDNQFASIANNVFPGINDYRPIPSLLPFGTAALPAPCLGLTAARRLDGGWEIYAGTQTDLYKWSGSAWINLTRASGGNYSVVDEWSFTQFGTHLLAVSGINDDPQWADIEAGSAFVALPGSPPRAATVSTIGDFAVLSGLATNPRRLRWSGVNDASQWTVGMNLCDEQEMADGGPIMATVGDTLAYIVQDRCIRLMQFLPGDIQFIFQISKVVKDKGTISKYGVTCSFDDTLYFMAEDGPYSLAGNQLNPIGQEKCSDWFLENSDVNRRNLVEVFVANKPYVVFAFHSNSAVPYYDRVIVYNWALQRFTTGSIYAEAWAPLGSKGLDLDTDSLTDPNDTNLDSASPSLDNFAYQGGRPLVCAINDQGQLCSLAGPNLAATLQTAEAHLVPGMRAFCSEVYPLCDTGNGAVAVDTRERLADLPVTSADYPIEITGSASVLTSARLHRFTLKLPFGEPWTHAMGMLAEAQPDGAA